MRRIPNVLSIAGTDPTGGAGIQADLKSISANGGYGMAVVTSLVAQNTRGVRSIHEPPISFLREQLDAVSDDVRIDAVKIGMLFTREAIAEVTDWLAENPVPVVVLDPVMIASSGDRLLDPRAETALRELLRQVHVVTPNLPELAVLAEEPEVLDWPAALAQAHRVSERYGVVVLVKGGHLGGVTSPDALVDAAGRLSAGYSGGLEGGVAGGRQLIEFSAERVATVNTHGTGCSLSSALATLQAELGDWVLAVEGAKTWLLDSLRHADDLKVGTGHGPIHHFAALWRTGGLPATSRLSERWWQGIDDVRTAIDDLEFITGLRDGTLPRESFRHYLTQDALYLAEYSLALTRAGVLAPTPEERDFWAASAANCLAVELELHRDWLSPTGAAGVQASALRQVALPAELPVALPAVLPTRVTTAYLNHLFVTAAGDSYPVLVAALLPCYWIYQDVGERLAEANHAGHPFADWLDSYADPAFAASTRQAIAITERAESTANDSERADMWRAFRTSALHELAFFAMGAQPPV
jgi:hydroxymethylpyrimidine/phosphomethylpyrimidine kinase